MYPILLLALGFLASEDPQGAASPRALHAPVGEETRVDVDPHPDGSVWVRGEGYKARFSRGGTTFVPFLGSRAPRNFELRLAPPVVSAGGEVLALEDEVDVRCESARAAYDRGGVIEAYALRDRDVEQTYEFRSRVAGPIVVRIGIGGDLEPRAQGPDLRFEAVHAGVSWGGVEYGGATAIDVRGRRLELTREFVDGAIEITVPAGFVADAEFPLVVDPVLSAYGVFAGSSAEELNPDVAFGYASQRYLFVSEQVFSATDHDVYSVLREFDGTSIAGSVVYLDSSDDDWRHPSVASQGYQTPFAVVAERRIAAGPRQVVARLRDGNALSATTRLDTLTSGEAVLPDVAGGDQDLVAGKFLAAWHTEGTAGDADVQARFFDGAGATIGSVIPIASGAGTREERVSIGKGSYSGNYSLTWQVEISPTNHDIQFARIDNTGALITPPVFVDASPSDDTGPVASDPFGSGSQRVAIAYQRANGGQSDVIVSLVDGAGGTHGVFDVSALDPATAGRDQYDPQVESDQLRFVVTWHEATPGGVDVFASEFHTVLLEAHAGIQRVPIESSTASSSGLCMASRTLNLGTDASFAIGWAQPYVGNPGDILAVHYQAGVGLPVENVCSGDGSGNPCPCGNNGATGHGCANSVVAAGALLATTGAGAVLADDLALIASGMPPNVTCLFYQSLGLASSGNAFGDGLRCATSSVIRLSTRVASSAGVASYPGPGDASISVRGNVGGGGVRYYQAWYRNAANFCTSSTFNLSNALRVRWTTL